MIGLNDYIQNKVFSDRGIFDIKDLVPGDVLYEYKTGNPLKVKDIICQHLAEVYNVSYSDGREMVYSINDQILNGDTIWNVIDLIHDNSFPEIQIFPFEFHSRKVKEPLFPDPYIAGALIINGRYDTPYINLPLDRSASDQHFAHKYNIDFADMLEDNTTFYAWNGRDKADPITWREFFPNYECFVRDRKITCPIIPNEYMTASINNRWKFIRGVFDIGYNKRMFPDSVGIANVREEKLRCVQQMLWSLGILSKISYDPKLPLARGREYRLDVIGSYDGYPGFFYSINAIEDQLINDNKLLRPINPFKLKISSIDAIRQGGATLLKGSTSNVILDKPHALYVTENFLPRVSW